jgi:aminopeptidase N
MRALSFKPPRTWTLLLLIAIPFQGCFLLKSSPEEEGNKTASEKDNGSDTSKVKAEKEKEKVRTRPVYHGSQTRKHDLVHTVLDVRFDMEERELIGEAEIDVTPHFYPSDSLTLDAKAFDVHAVQLRRDTVQKELSYRYDGRRIHIDLDSVYTRKDTFRVFIDYTANPTEVELEGSQAIASAQGLYFIDPLGKDPKKPTQIWTQGETESSSCWFPTIDAPNQKMTQEISITVPDSLKTLSNGALQYSLEKGEGERTDVWAQELPHAPYLTMMAIGDFAVVEDEWKDIPVNYWVEPEYESSAMKTFGNTPEMIDFYSDTFNFEYPWAKYDQVVVREFVSGAMENTTATVHGSMQRMTERELIDGDNEATIAHELIHHWFGNIVTCESWANLPLNEAFATYGEYLWEEHKYGREDADKLLQDKLSTYLRAYRARQKQVPLIRFGYEQREKMFDAFSYHKGSRVLHMLRMHVGDDAFFAALEEYLKDNAYEPVEIHDLRLAFEEVTGEDLNWFFEQWFMKKGHPVLDISYSFDSGALEQKVIVKQEQDLDEWPLYKLPMKIDLYYGEEKVRKSVTVDASIDTFSFDVKRRPDLVNVDAQKMLLCEKTDHKPTSAYIHQYRHAPLYLDRYEAIAHCKDRRDSLSGGIVLEAAKDDHYKIRQVALNNMGTAFRYYPEKARERLLHAAKADEHPPTRATALGALDDHAGHFKKKERTELYERALKDSSYMNVATALRAISDLDPARGAKLANELEDSESGDVVMAVASVYAQEGTPGKNGFFMQQLGSLGIRGKIGFLRTYSKYLRKQDIKAVEEALPALENEAIDGEHMYVQLLAVQAIKGVSGKLKGRKKALNDKLKELRKKEKNEEKELTEKEKKKRQRWKGELRNIKKGIASVEKSLGRIEKEVENERILRFLGGS